MADKKQVNPKSKIKSHTKILIIGAGDAGICAVRYLKDHPDIPLNQIRIIDPNTQYYYQSLQTMIGGGLIPGWLAKCSNKYLLPNNCLRVYSNVTKVHPEQNYVECDDGHEYSYDVLVVASGYQIKTEKVKGLKEALEDPSIPVGSNYYFEYSKKYSKLRSEFKGGEAVFTQPATPIKCPGAAQKIMYLSCASWGPGWLFKKNGLIFNTEFYTGGKLFFGNHYYREALEKVAQGYNAKINYELELVEIDGINRIAKFQNLSNKEFLLKKFDILHVTPPQGPPAFIQESGLANTDGCVLVDINTLQHKKFPNIFSIGDSASLPTSKTTSTLNAQVHVLRENVTSYLHKRPLVEKYDGYTSCPVFVGKGKLMLCEFGYDQQNMPTFFADQRKPSYFAFIFKVSLLPVCYLLFGPKFIRKTRLFFKSKRDSWVGCRLFKKA